MPGGQSFVPMPVDGKKLGGRDLVAIVQTKGEIGISLRIVWLEGERALVARDGGGELALLFERVAQIVVGLGIVRLSESAR